MNPHERQYVDWLLAQAVEQFVERALHRCGGPRAAKELLARSPDDPRLALAPFVSAFFAESLLDTPAGASSIVQALADLPAPTAAGGPSVGDSLQSLARGAFAAVLRSKAEEALDRAAVYEPIAEVNR